MPTSRKHVGLSPEELQEAEKQKELARVERKARYRLKKHGFYLSKMPGRHWMRKHYHPGYEIVDSYSNTIKWGCYNDQYDLRIEEVLEIIADLEKTDSA